NGHRVTKDVLVPRGVSTHSFFVPELRAEAEIAVEVEGRWVGTFRIRPKRKWKVHFIHHSHLDIGYSDTVEAVEEGQAHNLAKAIEYADETRDWPEGSRFKWTVESSWIVEQYLRAGGSIEALRDAVQRGQIEIAASYAGVFYDNCIDEVLLRQFYKVREFERLLGAPAGPFMVTDIPGWPWGLPQALAEAGVAYLDASPHYLFARPSEDFERPCMFYWQGPDADRQTLTHYSIYHYQEGNAGLKVFNGRGALEDHLPNRLARIADAGYPYDAYHVRIQGEFADNSKPNLTISETIRDWNRRWQYPRLLLSSNREFFEYIEGKYADEIPTVSGEISNWWIRQLASRPTETAIDRLTQRRLVEAETLASMAAVLDPEFEYPRAQIASAYQDTIIWKEHTHGYFDGKDDRTRKIWLRKKQCLDGARRACEEAIAKALEAVEAASAGPDPSIIVLNTRSWGVEDYVEADVPDGAVPAQFVLTDGESNEEVPFSQPAGGGKVRFRAHVPGLSVKTYRIAEGRPAAAPGSDLKADGAEMENRYYRISVDPSSGAVASIFDKELGVELVDGAGAFGMNQCAFRLKDDEPLESPACVGVEAALDAETASITVRMEARGIGTITQRLELHSGLRRIDVRNTLAGDLGAGELHYAFPFNVASPEIVYDAPFGPVRFLEDQLPGSALDYQTVQNWIDVSNCDYGVTLCSLDAPLVAFGEIRLGQYKAKQGVFGQPPETCEGGRMEPDNGHIYSFAMKSPWSRRFARGSPPAVTLRYSITTHKGPLDRVRAGRFGWERFCPPRARFVPASEGPATGPLTTLFHLTGDNVMLYVVKRAEEGGGFILRLKEVAGARSTVTVNFPFKAARVCSCTGLEETVDVIAEAADSVKLEFRPNEMKTIRIEQD
ncbi:MAG: glycoside hydrolase family 38 C-terminal domain-containing protein, partial [Planctomycetia bacterium]|nr:glycoside hydrolase family 38 C-terminal domain-containing protein [Planctomycetia bacterium]